MMPIIDSSPFWPWWLSEKIDNTPSNLRDMVSDDVKLNTYIIMNGVPIHNLDEFKQNFVIEEVMNYFHNCILLKWLLDCKYEEKAETIRKIMNDPLYDLNQEEEEEKYIDELMKKRIFDTSLPLKLCKIFNIDPKTQNFKICTDDIFKQKKRVESIKKCILADNITFDINATAFNQSEMEELLDKGINTIYLCPSDYIVPLDKKNKNYIGIGTGKDTVVVNIPSDEIVDFEKLGIKFKNIKFDKKYLKIIKIGKLLENINYVKQRLQILGIVTELKYTSSADFLELKEKAYGNKDLEAIQAMLALSEKCAKGFEDSRKNFTYSDYEMGLFFYDTACYILLNLLPLKVNDVLIDKEYFENKHIIGNAMYTEGLSYKKVKNYKEAFKCFKISAEIGNIDAMYYLGHLYNDGLGVDKSKELAKKWYQKSADGGKEKAKRILSNG